VERSLDTGKVSPDAQILEPLLTVLSSRFWKWIAPMSQGTQNHCVCV
jgi:hypothetical protein